MICPRCSVAEISETSSECQLCGYSPEKNKAVGVLAPDKVDERVQAELGHEFQVERELHRTADSRTYLARPASGVPVALTVFSRAAKSDPALEARFQRATHVSTSLDHPHIVPVYGSGRSATLLWCSTKFLEARPLAVLLRELGPLDLGTCRRMVEQIASALDHAHRRGISHGDVAAENILIDAQDWAYITHFGITQALRGVSPTRQGGPSGDQRDLAELVGRCLNLPSDASVIPAPVLQAVHRAASPEPPARFPTVLDFVAAFSTGTEVSAPWLAPATPRRKTPIPVLLPAAAVLPPAPAAPRPRRTWYVIGGAVLAFLLVWWFWPTPEAVVPFSSFTVPREAPVVVRPEPIPEREASPVVAPSKPATRAESPSPPQVQRPTARAPVPIPPPAPVGKGKVFVSSTPWGEVYIDGVFAGNTPQVNLPVPAGPHMIRVSRNGFQPYERQVLVVAGEELRLTDLVLLPR